ncbi:TPA: hypothetical protein ACWV4W_001171 [Salmonella enterica subsp. enterica serovar Muenchen]
MTTQTKVVRPSPGRLQTATIAIPQQLTDSYQQCRKDLVKITTPYPPERPPMATIGISSTVGLLRGKVHQQTQGDTVITGTVTGGV